MLEEMIKRNDHISTSEIQSDLDDTNRELKDLNDELEVVSRNRTENRVRIYMLEDNISIRQDLVIALTAILEYRKDKPEYNLVTNE